MSSNIDDTLERIESFTMLAPDWCGIGAKPVPREGARWLIEELKRECWLLLPVPYSYPTEDGFVSLEWDCATLEVDTEAKTGEFHDFEADTVKYDLSKREEWTELRDTLKSLS